MYVSQKISVVRGDISPIYCLFSRCEIK